ncbi:MAG: RHS repeat-associated core domain-containing protein [Candidatus Rokuibacteriota bacterium]
MGLDRRRVGGDRTIPQFGDTGREPDASDLIYYRARYYDPNTGRFAQRDPIGISGGLNLYAYANSNLVNLKGIEPLRYYQTAGG